MIRPLQCIDIEDLAQISAEAAIGDLVDVVAHDGHLRLRARDRDVEQTARLRFVAQASDFFERTVVGEATDSRERFDTVTHDETRGIVDREGVDRVARRRRLKLNIRKNYRIKFQSLGAVNRQDADGVGRLVEQRRLHLLRRVAAARDLFHELADRAADLLIVDECDAADLLELPQQPRAFTCGVIDRFDLRRRDDAIDQLRDGEMPSGLAEGFQRLHDCIPFRRRVVEDAVCDFGVSQREVRRARSRDDRAAVVAIRDRTKHGQQVDGRRAVEKESHRRHDVGQTMPIEHVEVVLDLRLAAEEQREAAKVVVFARPNPGHDRFGLVAVRSHQDQWSPGFSRAG